VCHPFSFEPYLKSLLEEEKQYGHQATYVPLLAKESDRERFDQFQPLSASHVTASPWENQEPTSDRKDSDQAAKSKPPIDVLHGLRQYASEHVLIVGKPGSGKSTSLNRLLWEEANSALLSSDVNVPVLIKLRRYTKTIEDSIQDSLTRHCLSLKVSDVERSLENGRFLLLLDGWNELQAQYQLEVISFCDKYRYSTPMVISARELTSRGGLRVSKVLTMLPLSKPLIQDFVSAYLGKKDHWLLREIEKDRLQQLVKTPLLLRMLCRVCAQKGRIPRSLGATFREFAQLHDKNIQGDAPAQTKGIWSRLLRHMAFTLMQGDNATELKLAMSRETAEDLLTKYLKNEDRINPRELAERGIQELLSYHLIQPVVRSNFEEKIEFHHQLIQEYYAAEGLLSRVETISDRDFQHIYINHLKWTESLSLMLSLMDKEVEVLRLIKLSLEVDLTLCARFCGDVRLEFQETALEFLMQKLSALSVCEKKRAKLLGISRSDKAISYLETILDKADVSSALVTIEALEHIASDLAIQSLIKITDHQKPSIRSSAIKSLGVLGAEQAFEKIREKLDDSNEGVRFSAVHALVSVGPSQVPTSLLKALDDQSAVVREEAAIALFSAPHLFGSEPLLNETISALLNEVRKSRSGNYFYSSEYALKALGRLNLPDLRQLVPELLSIARAHPNEIARVDILKLIGLADSDLALAVLSEIVKDYGLLIFAKKMILSAKEQTVQLRTLDASSIPSEALVEEHLQKNQKEIVKSETKEKIDLHSFVEKMSENISSSDIDIRKRAIWYLGDIFEYDSALLHK